ncbi:helix-turn-helix transcriptional regulator [Natrialbaceae archaeon AArc-T1-2]|uniref:helix-turn-helix transcriptional regulator n=1 Tax=Natrialbaceae archaeon AArc-T1-2 TaxID=3053904 RepID=UPI00255B3D25|nr:MarR family transcriptional regulator [Natrialbaceae archaeon AArc-T1-2]WIV67119.1 MarR family transcriptional regulator [Natrialbaceae archaeon AArc-T1-2]
MTNGDMRSTTADSAIGDVAYLTRSDHRVPALVAMTDRPRSRSELCELTGVSSSTIRRTLREFEDRTWIRKEGYQYEATQLGAAVADWMEELLDRIETERGLRDVWHWLPDDVLEAAIETRSEVTVTVAEPDAPYCPVNRFESLLRETNALRFLRPEVALMEPCLDVLRERIDDGIDVTLVDRPSCHTYFISTYPERSSGMMMQDNFAVLEHDDPPSYGIGLLDGRVIISCYEEDSGAVQAVIDTDVPAVREWAESTYAAFESEARPLEPDAIVE